MTYIEWINRAICDRIEQSDQVVCFGQNVTAGSCLSGLTRDLPVRGGIELLDTPNCENALVAFGFGMMLEGANSIFFVKQLDFLLLALDQLVNTYNMTRLRPPGGSFTIVPIVVDSGFEGPQSRLNNLADLCSMADLPGFALAEAEPARRIVERHLIAPGVRVLALSQRLLRSKPDCGPADPVGGEESIFRLAEGPDATLVAFNFAWVQARQLHAELDEQGIATSLFGVSACNPLDWDAIVESVARTGRLVLIDDSRVRNRPGDRLRAHLSECGVKYVAHSVYRRIDARDLAPQHDRFEIDTRDVRRWFDATLPRRGSRLHG